MPSKSPTMSSFFTVSDKKRKRAPATEPPKKRVAIATAKSSIKGPPKRSKPANPKPTPKRKEQDDESISGSDSDIFSDGAVDEEGAADFGSDSENGGETAAEKRQKLAERYLSSIKEEVAMGFDAADLDKDIIAERLRESVAEKKGKVFRQLADVLAFDKATHCIFRWNSHTVTGIAASSPYAYAVTKCGELSKWKIQPLPEDQFPHTTKNPPKKTAPPRKKPERVGVVKMSGKAREKEKAENNKGKKSNNGDYKGHTGEILAVAASQDGKFVVTGGTDKKLIVYDAKSLNILRVFTHHRDSILSLAFRRGTNQLFSASADRTIKVWSLDELAYVETLFGHQDHVVDIDALGLERCVSVGSRDRTARLWKVVEETQLVFRGSSFDKKRLPPNIDTRSVAHEGSIDRVAMLDEELFVTGSDNGSLALWSMQKKKPMAIIPQAHGIEPSLEPTRASAEKFPDSKKVVPPPQPRWITAVRTLPYSDVILTGSWDGYVRVWKLGEDKRSIEYVGILGASTSSDAHRVSLENSEDYPMVNGTGSDSQPPWTIKGVINDISVFQRDERGKGGLTVIASVGKEHRLGRWKDKTQGAKNGAVIFEVSRVSHENQVDHDDDFKTEN